VSEIEKERDCVYVIEREKTVQCVRLVLVCVGVFRRCWACAFER